MADKTSVFAAQFLVLPGKKFQLAKCNPSDDGGHGDKKNAKARIKDDAAAIDELQNRLYAEGKRALLVVLQGIDSSGKDGTIRAVFNACGPLGVTVTSFRAPSVEDLLHDYLWRVHRACPPRGIIGIFNRSHYEDVLVVKVKKLAAAEEIERRYEEINQFEKLLSQNGIRIVKFMLHISKEEQAERLRARLADPEKRWKFNPGDLADRALWDDYMAVYETAVTRCSTPYAPWYVIPSDRKWARNAAIARIVRTTLEDMSPQYPAPKDWHPAAIEVV